MSAVNPEHSENSTLFNKAQRLSRLINDMEGVLRSQRDILRRRGMNLPSGVLKGLQDAHIRLEKLINGLTAKEAELEQLHALADTTALINSSLELDEVLDEVMSTVIRLTKAERGYLMLYNRETGELEPRVSRNIDTETIEGSSFIVSQSVINSVAESGAAVVTTNAQDDPRFSSQESIVSYALRSILCVPLKHTAEVIGVIYTDNRIRAGLFGERELELLSAFANQAAVAIENARLFNERKLALAKITEIKDLMENVFTSIASGVIVTDGENQIIDFNQAAGSILHLHPENAIGQRMSDVLPTLADGLTRMLEDVRTGNRRTTIELTPELDERGRRNLNLKLSPLRNEREETEGVAIVLDDLTDFKEREAQLNVVRRYLPPAMVDNIQSIAQLGLGGVRRHITIMYADVRPTSSFSPDILTEPGRLMTTISQYFAVASVPVHRYEGVIDKYMGTEVMALFNTQLNPNDNPSWQAIQAALDMVDDFMALYAKQGEPPDNVYYRISIHSGIATMGNVGSLSRREFTAIGDTVNLAHRIVDMTPCGEILISKEVYDPCAELLSDPANNITIIDRGEVAIRGRDQLVHIYQLQRGNR